MYRNVCYKINKTNGPKWQGEIVLYTWDDKGNRITKIFPHNSHLYYEDPRGDHKSIYGTNLKREDFLTQMDRKRYVERHNGERRFFGANKPIREFMQSQFYEINESPDFARFPLRVHFFDLEIAVGDEFPDPYKAKYPINLISVYDTLLEKYFTWAMPPNKETVKLDRDDVVLELFDSEDKLLEAYMRWHSRNYPDVISGWNSMFFDVPYLVTRLAKVCDDDVCKLLSPVGSVYESTKNQKQKKMRCYNIDGITHLDYLFLYRDKFPPEEKRFSNGLSDICEIEVGMGKLEYEGTIKEFYRNDFEGFVKYNLRDVELLKMLDEKLMLIALTRAICNLGLCEYETIYNSIPYLYGALEVDEYRRTKQLYPSNIGRDSEEKLEKYKGAFVKKIEPKMFTRGVASIDLNSLYPNITIALNLSPETKFGKIMGKTDDGHTRVKIRESLEKYFDDKQMGFLLDKKCTLASNNVLYLKPEIKKGSIPTFLERIYNKRKSVKKEFNKLEKKISELKEKMEETKDASNKHKISAEIKSIEHESRKLFIEQESYKKVLNSIYGMMGSQYSAIFDIDNAEAITLTGQFIIKEASDFIDKTFKDKYKPGDMDYRYDVYNDTDSAYFDCSLIVNSVIGGDKFTKHNIRKICTEVDKFVNEDVNKFCYEELVKKKLYSNLDRIEFKREAFASSAIFLAKKRYVLHAKNNEGADVDKFKYVGVEVKKKEIPPMVSNMMKVIIQNLMDEKWNVSEARKYMTDVWEDFKKLKPEDIAYYKNLTKAKHEVSFLEAEGGAQVHARSAIYYNQLIDKLGLKKKYEEIRQGDRLRYVWVATNTFNIDCIAFKDKMPDEFHELFAVDYEKSFQKMFLKPMAPFLELSGVGKFDPRNNDMQDISVL